ncbi:hypothetical protein EVAR_57815_1 [Eumeta japonica]|uniref:Uncharacterized protein n=1 Tax=Eumeta variegata TaxID=151549 RepID=A0A4C1Z4X4_EUMVA|nr:hypothetical protein EVAR_57815_1 [Eumeta japonica]
MTNKFLIGVQIEPRLPRLKVHIELSFTDAVIKLVTTAFNSRHGGLQVLQFSSVPIIDTWRLLTFLGGLLNTTPLQAIRYARKIILEYSKRQSSVLNDTATRGLAIYGIQLVRKGIRRPQPSAVEFRTHRREMRAARAHNPRQ